MIRTIYWFLNFAITLLIEFPKTWKLKKLKNVVPEDEFDLLAESITANWALKQVKASGARIHINGLENIPHDRNVVFISNHQSNFDIAIFMSHIRKPKGFIAKVETLKIPIVKTFMTYINCVFMDRNDMKQSAKAILEGIRLLEKGKSLVIFPEGTRSKSDQIGEFKAGSFKLATKSKVPIIPVTISGTYKLMEENHNKITPADVVVTIHKMLETKELTREEQKELPDIVKNIIVASI